VKGGAGPLLEPEPRGSKGNVMSFEFSTAGCACLAEWHEPIAVSDIFTLLIALRRGAFEPADRPLLIIRVTSAAPATPPHVLSSLAEALPVLLDSCDELLVAIEGESRDRADLRATFESSRRSAAHASTRFFNTLSDALTHAQRSAPHDILDLQRLVLRRSVPPKSSATASESPTSQVWRRAGDQLPTEKIRRNR
jgi:hypothetical protein